MWNMRLGQEVRTKVYMRAPDTVKPNAAEPRAGDPPAAAPAPPRRGRCALVVLAAFLLLCVFGWMLRAPILTGIARLLTVHDRLEKADAIFVFGGDPDVRPFAAARLYREGWAPRVLVPGMQVGRTARIGLVPSQTEMFVAVLRHQGVPDSAIVVLPGRSSSTTADVDELRAWLQTSGVRRVICVTTDYHTRRARWSLRRGLRGVKVKTEMFGTAAAGFDETDWWRSENGLIAYFNEYVKFARYLVAGGAR
jgi:uncharacterized SAM-binding protein YcdF (DUF218 family)